MGKILVIINSDNIIIDYATCEGFLDPHKLEELLNKMYELDSGQTASIGDEYDPASKTITARPENYPQPSIEDLAELQIQAETRRLAIENLKAKGILPSDYVDTKAIPEQAVVIETQTNDVTSEKTTQDATKEEA